VRCFPGWVCDESERVVPRVAERRAVVTGVVNGIGKAIAQRFLADGVEVVGIDREEFAGTPPHAMVRMDLADLHDIPHRFAEIERQHGPVDTLVNVAGVWERIRPEAFSLESYRRVVTIDLDAAVVLALTAAESMAKRGYGRIVNVTSIHGEFGERGGLAYDAAKAGLDQATRTLAIEYGGRGVLCNAVAPGFVETRMSLVDGVLETETEEFAQVYIDGGRLPLGRAAQPEEIGGLVAWLCSSDNTYVTAQVIRIDGGLTATF
jgi:NAD(P)-dependent dehydrogenase (short-subunit alcohol dehydrogenase family)